MLLAAKTCPALLPVCCSGLQPRTAPAVVMRTACERSWAPPSTTLGMPGRLGLRLEGWAIELPGATLVPRATLLLCADNATILTPCQSMQTRPGC